MEKDTNPEQQPIVEKFENIARNLDYWAIELLQNNRADLHGIIETCHNSSPFADEEKKEKLTQLEALRFKFEHTLESFHELEEQSNDFLESLDITAGAFHHNLATNKFISFFGYIQFALEKKLNEKSKKVVWRFIYLPELLQQTAQHLRSVVARKTLLLEDGTKEETTTLKRIEPNQISEVVLGSRAFFEPIRSGGVSRSTDFISGNSIHTNIRVAGSASFYEKFSVSPDLVGSILYYLVSNASRKFMEDNSLTDLNSKDPKIEVSWSPVEYEGQKFIALEVFDNGEYIDLNSLYENFMRELKATPKMTISNVSKSTMNCIKTNSKSRQLDITSLIPSTDLPFLRGFSAMKSSGIGLGEARLIVEGGGGAVMINNVYGESSGVASTILIPQGVSPGELEEIRYLSEMLKNLLQTGEFTLGNHFEAEKSA